MTLREYKQVKTTQARKKTAKTPKETIMKDKKTGKRGRGEGGRGEGGRGVGGRRCEHITVGGKSGRQITSCVMLSSGMARTLGVSLVIRQEKKAMTDQTSSLCYRYPAINKPNLD